MTKNKFGIGEREIRFRAWDSLENKIIPDTALMYPYFEELDKLLMGMEKHFDILLMQYTGLKDKNGKEIYEGDILQIPNTSYNPENGDSPFIIDVVYWDKENSLFCTDYMYHDMADCSDCEIVGNIFSNPELLQ